MKYVHVYRYGHRATAKALCHCLLTAEVRVRFRGQSVWDMWCCTLERWDRQVVPKRLSQTTNISRVKSQTNAYLVYTAVET